MPGWIGVNNKPREIANIYVGVNNRPMKVQAAWVGVNSQPKKWYELAPSVTQQSIAISISSQYEFYLNSGQGISAFLVNDAGQMTPYVNGSTLVTNKYIQRISVGYDGNKKPGVAQIVLGTPSSGWTQDIELESVDLAASGPVSGKNTIGLGINTSSGSQFFNMVSGTTSTTTVQGPITGIILTPYSSN